MDDNNNDQNIVPFNEWADLNIPFGNGKFSDVLNPSYMNAGGYSVELKFYNQSTHSIYLYKRDGTIVTLIPDLDKSNIHNNTLIIQYTVRGNGHRIEVIDGDEDELVKFIKRKLILNNGLGYSYIETVQIDDIKRSRNGVYLLNADAMVSAFKINTSVVHHPFSAQRIHNSFLLSTADFDPSKEVSINIRLVDHDNVMSNAYVIISGKVMVIQSRKIPSLKSGVYISGFVEYVNGDVNTVRNNNHYTFDDIDKNKTPLMIFKTLKEANNKITEMLVVGKLDDSLEKAMQREHDAKMAEIKRERETLQVESSQLKEQMMNSTNESNLKIDQMNKEHELKMQDLKASHEKTVADAKKKTETIKLTAAGVGLVVLLVKLLK